MKLSKAQLILNYVKKSGTKGRRFSEIQRFIVEHNGYDYDERQVYYKLQYPDTDETGWDYPTRTFVKTDKTIHWPAKWEYVWGLDTPFKTPPSTARRVEEGILVEYSRNWQTDVYTRQEVAKVVDGPKKGPRVYRGYYCTSLQYILQHCHHDYKGRYFFSGTLPNKVYTRLAMRSFYNKQHMKFMLNSLRSAQTTIADVRKALKL